MRKSSTHGFCTILCKALMTFCCLLALHVYHAAAQAPTFTSSPVTTATVGQPYQYSVQATDPNNLPMTFSAGSMPSWLSFSTAGQSTSSQFGGTVNAPGGVAGDAAGNIYVTENYGTKIYKITPDGTMTHWATRPVGSVYAMLVVGDDLLVSYYSINSTNRITKINLTGTPTETPWISSPALNNPLSMVERNGFLFVADYGAGRLRKVNLNTGAVSDVLTLSGIFGLGFNSAGTLYLASYGLRKIYTADVTSGNPQNTLTEVLSFTPNITDVKIDANDNVYISANGFVRKYNPSLTSFVPCWSGSGWVWGMSLTTGGTLVFGLNSANMVHRLQTGAVLTGTPALADIGVHNVSLDVTNGTQTTNQGFSISVSGPSTFQTSPITVPYGTAAITLSDPASNSSGAFTYTSNNNAVASVNGNILTIAGMGTATITATQAASGLYLQTPRTFTVTVTAPAPSFGSWPAISKLRNDAPFTLTAPASNSSGNITYSSSNQQVATISGTTVTITGIGTTTITASQVAAGNYAQGSTTTTLTVSSGVPVIGSLTLASKTYGDQPFTLTDPASNSNGTFSYTSSNTQVATINNNVVTIVGVGSTDITATQAAAGSFNSGSVTATLQVAPATPVIANWSLPTQTFGTAAFQLSDPVSNSGGAFTFTTSDANVANLNGNTINMVGVGTATITATQAAAGNYTAGSVQAVITVVPASPVLGNLLAPATTYGDAPFQLVDPSSNSNGQFSYTSSNLEVATISGNTVTIVGAGTTTINAVQAATSNYTAGQTNIAFAVAKANPVITTPAAIGKVYGDAAFALAAPASNSNGVFTYTTSNTGVVNLSGNTATIAGAGTATITATQAATANYDAGVTTISINVAKANPSITAPADISKVYGDVAFALTSPVSNSSGAWSYATSNNTVATISGNTATIAGAGAAPITATQAATNNYNAAQITYTLNVAAANPVIVTPAAISKVYGDPAFTLAAPQSTSNGGWSYTSSNTGVVRVSGNSVTVVGAGTATVTATQAASANYNAGNTTISITVAKANPVVSTPATISKQYGDGAFAIAAPQSNSTGAWSYASSNTGVATINGNNVTNVGAGTTTITATQAATANYNAAQVSTALTVGKAPLTITATSAFRCVGYANPQFSYTISGYVNGEGASVLSTLPVVQTTATQNSVAGTYVITVSGASAANYTISYMPGVLTVNNPQHTAQRYAVVDAIAGEATPLQARSFGTQYQWAPQTGLNNSRVAMPAATLQKEQQYTIAITEATGCVVTDTLLVRTFSKPDVFVPNLFSPNGDGVNDELRINPVGIKQLYYFRIFDRYGKVLFETRNLTEGWNGRFGGQLQRMDTYSWILSGRDKNGKWLTTSGSVTLVR